MAIILNNQQQDDCSMYNSTIGPIRFPLGYRKYLIGYSSYSLSLSSSKYSLLTMVALLLTSCLLIIVVITLVLYFKCRKSNREQTLSSSRITRVTNDKPLWSTESSASTAPYYQVYEQNSCSSSLENPLRRAPLLFCPHYQEKRHCTSPIIEQIQDSSTFLSNLTIDDEKLKQLIFRSNTDK